MPRQHPQVPIINPNTPNREQESSKDHALKDLRAEAQERPRCFPDIETLMFTGYRESEVIVSRLFLLIDCLFLSKIKSTWL